MTYAATITTVAAVSSSTLSTQRGEKPPNRLTSIRLFLALTLLLLHSFHTTTAAFTPTNRYKTRHTTTGTRSPTTRPLDGSAPLKQKTTTAASSVLFRSSETFPERTKPSGWTQRLGSKLCKNPFQKSRRMSSPMIIMSSILSSLALGGFPKLAWAGGGGMARSSSAAPLLPLERNQFITLSSLWLVIFVVLAMLHAAEIAITTLYPWQVREIAQEEEKQGKANSVFRILNQDITRVLTTILVASTACSIFATTLFTHIVGATFGARGERYGALALTALTLFFVELLPKSLGVVNAEIVARLMVPPIHLASVIVSPLGISLSWMAKKTLQLVGVKDKGNGGIVSDSQLRLIVTGALDSGTIDHSEQEMIQGVLDLQNQRVKEIMKPRVEMIAVPCDMSVVNVLGVVRESGYSRIPVYDGEIDNIVGIVLAKSVLDFFVNGVIVDDQVKKFAKTDVVAPEVEDHVNGTENNMTTAQDGDVSSERKLQESLAKAYNAERIRIKTMGGKDERYVRSLTAQELADRMEMSIKDADLIESCYFVPDTANGWSVLQEMRRRRVHMAIVVDEFGGTEGLVSLEDIVEEVGK